MITTSSNQPWGRDLVDFAPNVARVICYSNTAACDIVISDVKQDVKVRFGS